MMYILGDQKGEIPFCHHNLQLNVVGRYTNMIKIIKIILWPNYTSNIYKYIMFLKYLMIRCFYYFLVDHNNNIRCTMILYIFLLFNCKYYFYYFDHVYVPSDYIQLRCSMFYCGKYERCETLCIYLPQTTVYRILWNRLNTKCKFERSAWLVKYKLHMRELLEYYCQGVEYL
jgi:hypothetical protein